MPELPEVQTIVDQLEKRLVGKKIEGIEVRLAKVFQGNPKDIIGKKITKVSRRAKMINIDLEGPRCLVIHLKMTGQLIYVESQDKTVSFPNPIPFAGATLPAKTTHVVFKLNQGTLFYNDMRRFGWIKVVNDKELSAIDEKHGPEPFSREFTSDYLAKITETWNRPIKLLLLEQSKIAGIGNIYANEALWCARINPLKKGKEVEPKEIKDLYDCIKKVLKKGLEYGGSSAADEAFVNVEGKPGRMQEHFNVYQKSKKPCPRGDGGTVQFTRIGGRGTFFCPVCQK
jgi:formamidopyrimidine-DNA glycosylase